MNTNNTNTSTVFRDRDQTWRITWHPTQTPPVGKPQGANGVCVTEDGGIVLISEDGQAWDFPGGRPEGDETWEETLRREVAEEACATTQEAGLLGFCCAECLAGAQLGEWC
jgi:NUDIX domain